MAGDVIVNRVILGDHATPANNLILKTNQDGTFLIETAAGLAVATIDSSGRVRLNQSDVAFSGYLTSNTAYSSGVFSRLQNFTQDFDTANAYDPVANRFTAPVAGIYLFHPRVYLDMLGSATLCEAAVYKNGVFYNFGMEIATAGAALLPNASITMQMAAGDYADFYVYQNTGGSRTVYGADRANTGWSGHLIART